MPADFGVGEAAAAGAAAEAGSTAAAAGSAAAAAGAAGAGTSAGLAGIMSAAMPYISLVSTAISAGSAIFGGIAGARGAAIQDQQYQEQADIAKTQALEQETQREQVLMATVGTQQAIRAGRGVDLYSPTGRNITQVSQAAEQRDVQAITANEQDALAAAQLGEQASANEATGAIISGVGDAVGVIGGDHGGSGLIKGLQNLTSKANSTS